MREDKFLDGMGKVEADVVERFISIDDRLHSAKGVRKSKGIWLRVCAVAACFALIIGAAVIVPMLRGRGGVQSTEPTDTTETDIFPPHLSFPQNATMTVGGKLTGKRDLVYGTVRDKSVNAADIAAPYFSIRTVVEVEVVEVLDDVYRYDLYRERFCVARLRIIDEIRGEGLPEEIFLCYPFYDTSIFDGYDSFIMSLRQCGAENFMLVNDTQGRVDYFSNMFTVNSGFDIGYGCVIALNDGKPDVRFLKKANYSVSKYFPSNNDEYHYDNNIITDGATVSDIKTNILKQVNKENNRYYVADTGYDFVCADDIFTSKEAKALQTYLQPSETNSFACELFVGKYGVNALYTRVINGFMTNETILIRNDSSGKGKVERSGEAFTQEDIVRIADIGDAIEKMELSSLQPPHIDVVKEMRFEWSQATGAYRKVNGKVYGIVRVLWYYSYPDYIDVFSAAYTLDDMYYLYDGTTSCIVEREALREIIGKDSFIKDFRYNSVVAVAY